MNTVVWSVYRCYFLTCDIHQPFVLSSFLVFFLSFHFIDLIKQMKIRNSNYLPSNCLNCRNTFVLASMEWMQFTFGRCDMKESISIYLVEIGQLVNKNNWEKEHSFVSNFSFLWIYWCSYQLIIKNNFSSFFSFDCGNWNNNKKKLNVFYRLTFQPILIKIKLDSLFSFDDQAGHIPTLNSIWLQCIYEKRMKNGI